MNQDFKCFVGSHKYKVYKEEPVFLFSSPGRIELIGNHTDHNHGKVIVSTLDLSILALVKKTDDNFFVYKTNGFNDWITIFHGENNCFNGELST